MLCIGRRTAIAADENLIAIRQRREHQVDGLSDMRRQHGGRLDFDFGTFVEVREDALIIHSVLIIVQAFGTPDKC